MLLSSFKNQAIAAFLQLGVPPFQHGFQTGFSAAVGENKELLQQSLFKAETQEDYILVVEFLDLAGEKERLYSCESRFLYTLFRKSMNVIASF